MDVDAPDVLVTPRVGRRRRPPSIIIESGAPAAKMTKRSYKTRYRRSNPYKYQIHKFKRTYEATSVSTDGINPSLNAINFSMNDMPGYTELTALFDFYKLTGVKVKWMPNLQTESNSISAINNARNTPIYYAIDRNDSTVPGSTGEVLENNDHQIAYSYTGFTCWIPSPKFADATSAARGGWIATTNPSQNWYGLKVAIPPTGVANTFTVLVTFYCSCKDAK